MRSFLIQRLEKSIILPEGHPWKDIDNPFAFGGGLVNGGLSKEAMNVLRPIFRFDYMGSSEFEYGAVPKALARIAENAKNLVKTELRIPNERIKVMNRWDLERCNPLPKGGETVVYILCQRDHLEHVKTLIYGLIDDENRVNLKEHTGLVAALLERKDGTRGRVCGWLELDNGFFFFSDKEMFEKTAALFPETICV